MYTVTVLPTLDDALTISSSITVPFPFHSGSSNEDLYLLRDEV